MSSSISGIDNIVNFFTYKLQRKHVFYAIQEKVLGRFLLQTLKQVVVSMIQVEFFIFLRNCGRQIILQTVTNSWIFTKRLIFIKYHILLNDLSIYCKKDPKSSHIVFFSQNTHCVGWATINFRPGAWLPLGLPNFGLTPRNLV